MYQSPLFKTNSTPAFALTNEQVAYLASVCQKMLAEQGTDYLFKNDLVRTYLQLLIHKTLRTQPTENFRKQQGASSHLATLFLELPERLFPVEIPDPRAIPGNRPRLR